MIRHTNLRDNGDGQKNIGDYEQSAADALRSMVVFELGYGGIVSDLSPTSVVVKTRVLACKDTTIFEGSEEEMEFIVRVAAHHVALMSDEASRNTLVEKAVDFLEMLPEGIRGVPFYITMMAPLLTGGPSAGAALLVAAGITDPEVVKELLPVSLKELVAAVELYRETGTPLPEIVREMKLVSA